MGPPHLRDVVVVFFAARRISHSNSARELAGRGQPINLRAPTRVLSFFSTLPDDLDGSGDHFMDPRAQHSLAVDDSSKVLQGSPGSVLPRLRFLAR